MVKHYYISVLLGYLDEILMLLSKVQRGRGTFPGEQVDRLNHFLQDV